jgi:RHS repeat-associated protein
MQRLDYDRWGAVIADTNPGFQPFGYAAGLWDADTGLVRFGQRDYSPELNRWTSKDPLGFAAGDTSLYVYGFGDPVSFVDPSGEVVPFVAGAILIYKGADFLWNAYDAYQTAKLLMDPCISTDDKLTEVALIAVGIAAGAVVGKGLRALRRAKAASRIGCFVAGTWVLTATAASGAPLPIAIEAVQPGALVRAYDAATDAVVTAQVTAVHERPGIATLALGLESEQSGSSVLMTTPEHPLWSWSAGGYVAAERIERGDWLFTHDADWAHVASASYTGRTETVYNLTVEGAESFFVGEAGVLAHNNPACAVARRADGDARFIVEPNGTVVDTHSTPRGSYTQPDTGRTDILQGGDHGAGYSHTHDPIVNTNPRTGETFFGGWQQPGRPVSAEDVANIVSGQAPPAPPKGR